VDFPPLAKNLVSKILKLNPSERLSVEEILDHSWFTQNPPLRHVLTNYLTDEKDILKSHLIIATPESVEDKINNITLRHKKRNFGTLKIKYNDEDSNDINSNSDNNIISIKDNVDDNKENEQNRINENKQDNNDIITRMYMSNIHENYIFLKKEKKELQKKYDELVIKEQKENDLIKILDEENKKLKNKKENLKNSHLMIINEEIKKYKLLSEDREKILNELDEVNNKNSELYLQNELLQNTITLMKKEQEELNNKIINLTKENNDYLSQIEELTKKLEELGSNNNNSGITLNFEDQNKLANQLNEMTEQNMKKLNEYISPINLNFINLEKKVEDLINDKVLSLVDSKIKTFDDLLNEKNDKNNSDIYFEENKKLIEELKESKNKISVNNNNDDKFNDLKNKNNILEERIKTLMEEKKVSDELNESKNKELEKAKTTIKNLNDKIYDINSYINSNCKNESFKKKLCTICQLDDFK
jgi:chromosome segregation ATPase